jgi:hypothetical protein
MAGRKPLQILGGEALPAGLRGTIPQAAVAHVPRLAATGSPLHRRARDKTGGGALGLKPHHDSRRVTAVRETTVTAAGRAEAGEGANFRLHRNAPLRGGGSSRVRVIRMAPDLNSDLKPLPARGLAGGAPPGVLGELAKGPLLVPDRVGVGSRLKLGRALTEAALDFHGAIPAAALADTKSLRLIFEGLLSLDLDTAVPEGPGERATTVPLLTAPWEEELAAAASMVVVAADSTVVATEASTVVVAADPMVVGAFTAAVADMRPVGTADSAARPCRNQNDDERGR